MNMKLLPDNKNVMRCFLLMVYEIIFEKKFYYHITFMFV